MPLKRVIDADKISADRLFLRESASACSENRTRMPLKRVIDADKISADRLFLRESASAFHRYQCPQACRLFTFPPGAQQQNVRSPLDSADGNALHKVALEREEDNHLGQCHICTGSHQRAVVDTQFPIGQKSKANRQRHHFG